MPSTTDFEEWLSNGHEPDDFEEAYALYCAANGESMGGFEVNEDGDRLFIKGYNGTLALVSKKARDAFCSHIQRFKGDADMDWESWYGYMRAMAKDD